MTYNGSEFVWFNREGSAEASMLGLAPGLRPSSQCYSDSCDEGFKVYSPKTGRTLEFVLWEYDEDRWLYKSTCGLIRITVFND